MEARFGSSEDWDRVAEERGWDKKEALLDELWDTGDMKRPQPEQLKLHVMRSWIEWAWQVGDKTWKNWADEEGSFLPPAKQYQDEKAIVTGAREVKGELAKV